MKNLLIMLVLCVLLCAPVYAVELMPNVDVAFTATPTSGTTVTTVTRTTTFTNSNVDVNKLVSIGIVLISKGSYSQTFPLNFSIPMAGARNGIIVSNTLPAEATFISGSLKYNDVVQANPVVTNGNYDLTVNVPAQSGSTAGKVVVVDQWLLTPPLQ
jgi:hypothetical protein